MQLTDQQINKFQQLFKQEKGFEISPEQAREQIEKLVALASLTYKPIPKTGFSKITINQNQKS